MVIKRSSSQFTKKSLKNDFKNLNSISTNDSLTRLKVCNSHWDIVFKPQKSNTQFEIYNYLGILPYPVKKSEEHRS